LYDVRVLASSMAADDWDALMGLAGSEPVRTAVSRTLVAARDQLGADVPERVVATLRTGGTLASDAPFTDPHAPHIRRVLSDLNHVGGWRLRLQLVRQHLFPPAAYMRTVFAPASPLPLWMLYARRIVRGSRRWMGWTR
jgi:hypothetical protein